MKTRRCVIDYALQRRALLAQVRSGRVGTDDACDATPYLLSAARFHGQLTDQPCPVCRREPLWHVRYVYGEELKTASGQARSSAELATMAQDYRSFTVYQVEVCRGCGWNHLATSYLLGRDGLHQAAQGVRGRAAGR